MAVELLESPWRSVFEELRSLVGNQRDEQGVLGSINWLRKEMEKRRANPNVVRNIIYRDKGKLSDKRALFEIIQALWQGHADRPLQAPELEALLSAESGAEQEVAQLLGREKRRAYSSFVSGVRAQQAPSLLITGRPGSGKTLLMDYIQQALELPPKAADKLVRFDFSSDDLAASLTQFALKLGLRREALETKLLKVSAQSAYAVQADAQADVARTLTEALKTEAPLVLMLHLSQPLAEQDNLSESPLRLNTADVPRVNAAEWLWMSLLAPLSQLANVSLIVSMVNVPARALQTMGKFDGPIKLNPPTAAEARRFVKARLPQLSTAQQEAVVQRAGRSFEELRTLTLLAEIREPLPEEGDTGDLEQLEKLLSTAGDARLRNFLKALAVMSVPEFSTFSKAALLHLRKPDWQHLSNLELAFLDLVPGEGDSYRCFSRRLARRLNRYFEVQQAEAYTALNAAAAQFYETEAFAEPSSEAAAKYLYHLLEARDWNALETWLKRWSIPQALLHRLWQQAENELLGRERFETIALQVAAHYVRLGSYTHPDALRAFALLEGSERPDVRLWTNLKQAEGAVLKGQIEEAETLLAAAELSNLDEQPSLNVERALIKASIARWRSDWQTATRLVETARPLLGHIPPDDAAGQLIHAKVAVWAGLIAKDQGDLSASLSELRSVVPGDDLVQARVDFQMGDVLLQLGYFDEALKVLDDAVERARRSEALTQEQTRFLARRARLHRLRADFDKADADFAEAHAILQSEDEEKVEVAFWRAKLEDEQALLYLARGQFNRAIFVLTRNQDSFSHFEKSHSVDASYRKLRSGLRLALSYGLRAHAAPFIQPLNLRTELSHQDLDHARHLITTLDKTVATRAASGEAYGYLEWYTLLLGSLLSERPEDAVKSAQGAVQLARFSYQEAESSAYLGTAYLRLRQKDEVLSAVRQGQQALERTCQESGETSETGDVGLATWLRNLELQALILKGNVSGAADSLRVVDSLNPPYSEALLRTFGGALETQLGPEARRHPDVTQLFGETIKNSNLRLPDALVAQWRKLGRLQEHVLA